MPVVVSEDAWDALARSDAGRSRRAARAARPERGRSSSTSTPSSGPSTTCVATAPSSSSHSRSRADGRARAAITPRRPRSSRPTRARRGKPPPVRRRRRARRRSARRGRRRRRRGRRRAPRRRRRPDGSPPGIGAPRRDDQDQPASGPARGLGDDRDGRLVHRLGEDEDVELGQVAQPEVDVGGVQGRTRGVAGGPSTSGGRSRRPHRRSRPASSVFGGSSGVSRVPSRRSAT